MPILSRQVESVRFVVMSNPGKHNAFDRSLLQELATAISAADDDSTVRVIVVTGADTAFCAGGDVSGMSSDMEASDHLRYLTDDVHGVPRALVGASKPTVAMINGAAVGAGLDIALACDFRVCVEGATLREAYIDVGLAAGDGGAWWLPRLIGLSRALDLLLTGRKLSPTEALEMGLVHRLAPREDLEKVTMELAEELTRKPPQALAAMKRLVHQSVAVDMDEGLRFGAAAVAILSVGSEHKNRVESFMSKR